MNAKRIQSETIAIRRLARILSTVDKAAAQRMLTYLLSVNLRREAGDVVQEDKPVLSGSVEVAMVGKGVHVSVDAERVEGEEEFAF